MEENIIALDRLDGTIIRALHDTNRTDMYRAVEWRELHKILEADYGESLYDKTVWKHLQFLVKGGYVSYGMKRCRAKTYYLNDKGMEIMNMLLKNKRAKENVEEKTESEVFSDN